VLTISVVLIGSILPATAEAASLKDQIAAAKERQAALTKSIERSESLVASLKQDQADTQAAIVQTREDLSDIRADLDATIERIKKVRERITRIEERHAELLEEQRQTDFTLGLLEQELANGEADLRARREAFGLRLIDAYRSDNTTLIDQIFTADSFSEVLTDTSSYLAIGEQDAQLAEQIAQDQQALDSLRLLTTSTRLRTDQIRRDTEDTWDMVVALRQQLKAAERRLKVLERKKEAAWERQQAALASIIKNKKQMLAAAAAMRRTRSTLQTRINGLVARAQRSATAKFGVRAGSGSGRLAWPANGSISQGYGCTSVGFYPPGGGCSHFHDGIDIAGASGSGIVASADGVVAYAGWNPYEGYSAAYIVVIAHGGGISTLYAHMQPTGIARAGQTVRRGQLIGRMGSTGNSTGTHLHFEVWSGGDWNPVNPYAYL
jgi:murein DD-endopeptidase MepM/ murein hydrolase activator NlpD